MAATRDVADSQVSSVTVTTAGAADRAEWDAFVVMHPDAAGYHEWLWRDVITRAFGHRAVYLLARRGRVVVGILPLVEIRSVIFGRTMTSMPFLNYGGVLASDAAAAFALRDTASAIANDRKCRHVELRHFARQFEDLPFRQHKVTMRLPLQAGMWEHLDRKVRNQVRKAEKSNLTAIRGGIELLDQFYAVFSRNMRDLGTPVYGRVLFQEVLQAFPGRAELFVVRLNDQPIAASLRYRTGQLVEVPWASSIRDFNNLCPNHLLYWRMIEAAVAEGCATFDFGRSTPGEGTFKFKEQWGAAPVPLHWEYLLPPGAALPDQGPTNPKFKMAIEAWKRLPLPVATWLGPSIVRSIP